VALSVELARGDDAHPIVAFRELTDRTAAEAFRGWILEVGIADLPLLEEDEYYPFDLIGLVVRDEAGIRRGEITDCVETPAHAMLMVRVDEGQESQTLTGSREVLVPFIYEAVPTVDTVGGYVVVASAFLGEAV
jgi:16S rRNA processing protein RimM